jgi:hypothetical protein
VLKPSLGLLEAPDAAALELADELADELFDELFDELLDPQAATPTISAIVRRATPSPLNLMCIPTPPGWKLTQHAAGGSKQQRRLCAVNCQHDPTVVDDRPSSPFDRGLTAG